MHTAIALILFYQVAGEALTRLTGLPVPGPVFGMLLMLLTFFIRDDLIEKIRPTASVLIANLGLFFVPAGVGLMRHGHRFLTEGIGIIAVIMISSVLALLATAYTIMFVQKKLKLNEDEDI